MATKRFVRGARNQRLQPAACCGNIEAIGNDGALSSTILQNQTAGVAGTSLATFGTAQNGLPASVVAPSLLFEEVEVRGRHGANQSTCPLLPEAAHDSQRLVVTFSAARATHIRREESPRTASVLPFGGFFDGIQSPRISCWFGRVGWRFIAALDRAPGTFRFPMRVSPPTPNSGPVKIVQV